MDLTYTIHARKRMLLYGMSEAQVESTLKSPDSIEKQWDGRQKYARGRFAVILAGKHVITVIDKNARFSRVRKWLAVPGR